MSKDKADLTSMSRQFGGHPYKHYFKDEEDVKDKDKD
jgi:hypothetical protein